MQKKLTTQPPRLPSDYASFLSGLKERIRSAQVGAALSVNRELILLYWDLGRAIVQAQAEKGYGNAVVERIVADLHQAFPAIKGFSPRNVWRMRAFYLSWTESAKNERQGATGLAREILPQLVAELDGKNLPRAVAEIPWGHNVCLLEKVKNPLLRLWYAQKTIEHGWSRALFSTIRSRPAFTTGRARRSPISRPPFLRLNLISPSKRSKTPISLISSPWLQTHKSAI